MKRILCIGLAILLLSGCTTQENSIPVETATPTEPAAIQTQPEVSDPTEAEPIFTQQPMVAVSVPHSTETVTASNGSTIFRSTKQSMQLTMRDPDVADKIILDFLNRVDSHSQSIETAREAAESSYTEDTEWSTHFYDLIYDPMRIDHSVLSLYGESVSYANGNHPQRVCLAANYNMVTGDVLTLGSILYHIDTKSALADLVVEGLDAVAKEKYLMEGYQTLARRRFQRDESFDEEWYFTGDGLCFYFAPYEIAPYSSGVITVTIPYNKLTGIIDNAFFPPETDLTSGSIEAIAVQDADMSQFTQIAEVTVHDDGQMYFLYTGGHVSDIRIELSTENSTHIIFATKSLTPGDAIMVKTASAEELNVVYESGGEVQQVSLSEIL